MILSLDHRRPGRPPRCTLDKGWYSTKGIRRLAVAEVAGFYVCGHHLEILMARWAVFFDADGIEWQYEQEGFDLPGVGRYLPDFWLPRVSMFAEVRPTEFSLGEVRRCQALAKASGRDVLLLAGEPDLRSYNFIDANGNWMDAVVDGSDDHGYYRDENRFFVCTGGTADANGVVWLDGRNPGFLSKRYVEAVNAARGARFEHGESGNSRG